MQIQRTFTRSERPSRSISSNNSDSTQRPPNSALASGVRDTVSVSATAGVAALAASAGARALGAGPLLSTALALPTALLFGAAGGFAAATAQSQLSRLLGAELQGEDVAGAYWGGAIASGLSAGVSVIAAGFGVEPASTGLIAAGSSAALLNSVYLLD